MLPVSIDRVDVETVSTYKYLGLVLELDLSANTDALYKKQTSSGLLFTFLFNYVYPSLDWTELILGYISPLYRALTSPQYLLVRTSWILQSLRMVP